VLPNIFKALEINELIFKNAKVVPRSQMNDYGEDRARVFEEFQSNKKFTTDEMPQNIPTTVANKYLEIKNAGLL